MSSSISMIESVSSDVAVSGIKQKSNISAVNMEMQCQMDITASGMVKGNAQEKTICKESSLEQRDDDQDCHEQQAKHMRVADGNSQRTVNDVLQDDTEKMERQQKEQQQRRTQQVMKKMEEEFAVLANDIMSSIQKSFYDLFTIKPDDLKAVMGEIDQAKDELGTPTQLKRNVFNIKDEDIRGVWDQIDKATEQLDPPDCPEFSLPPIPATANGPKPC